MVGRFEGKTALILGGTSGMGLAAAKGLLAEGAQVIITGRKQEKIDAAAEELEGDFVIYRADIADYTATKDAIDQGVDKFGKIDVFYQVAGIGSFMPFDEADQKHFEEVVDVDLMGPIVAALNVREHLNDNASVIFTTTTASTRAMPTLSAYGAAKAGLDHFARVLALEFAPRNIRVNTISPGPIDTPIFNEFGMPEEMIEGTKQYFSMLDPLGRLGRAEEVAKAALFLASDDASYVTGVTLQVDGGFNQSWHLQPQD